MDIDVRRNLLNGREARSEEFSQFIDLKKWQNWKEEGRVFLVSQHFKEVIVILANAAGIFYKAFRTSRLILCVFLIKHSKIQC